MNALESTLLEALAFDNFSCGLATLVNSVWTWVAVLTAAISFWRIRSSSPTHHLFKSVPVCDKFSSPPEVRTEVRKPEPGFIPGSLAFSVTASFCGVDRQGSTKGKFAVYYRDGDDGGEVEMDGENEAVDGDGCGSAAVEGHRCWWSDGSWEIVLNERLRIADEMGWYRCQDLTMLNGNVVRLWDGGRW